MSFKVEKLTPHGDCNPMEGAILAGGCFWGVEEIIRQLPGIISTTVGYCGGRLATPKYSHVKKGDTDHAEAVKIEFDPAILTYADLLTLFFRLHDPTQKNRQMNDVGSQYRSVIFYTSEAQHKTALEKIDEVNRSGKWKGEIVTEVIPAPVFWDAEAEHQDYLQKNPEGYNCHWVRP